MPPSYSPLSKLENKVINDLRNLHMEVTDQSHHNKYNLTGNAVLNQHYGAVYNQTILPAQPKLPPLPRCPPPSTKYTKRENIENHIRSYFFDQNQGGRKCYVLHGPGGTGKTEIGLTLVDEYYYSREPGNKCFADVYWIDATTERTIDESFKAIALSTGAGSEAKDALLLLASRDGLDANWMVFFNNADNPELDLAKYFPKCSHGNILISTRNYHARRHGVGPESDCAVSQMTADEAFTLFMKHARISSNANPSSIDEAKALVKELGYSVLSVSQAGAFISMKPFTPGQYFNLYCERRQELLCEHERMKTTNDYPYHSVHATLMISYEMLSDPAKDVVLTFGCLHHEGVLERMFSKSFSSGLDELESKYALLFTGNEKAGLTRLKKIRESLLSMDGNWDVMKFRDVISKLQSYSLVTFDPWQDKCTIHPLVHELVRNIGNMEERSTLRHSTILLLGSSLVDFDSADDLAFCRALAPHVDQIFQGIDPKTSACGGRFGTAYWEAGRWDNALVHRELHKELCTRELGNEHLETLRSIADVVSSYYGQGRYDEVEELGLQVVETQERVLGAEHRDTLASVAVLAATYSAQRRFEEGEKLFLEVVETQKKVLGIEHPDTLTSIGNLASTYAIQRRFQEAKKLLLEVVETQKKFLGLEHPNTLSAMYNLASTYSGQRQFSEAEKLFLEVVEVQRRVLGAEHPYTLVSIGHLAYTYLSQWRFKDAEGLLLEAMEAQKKVFGAAHSYTLTSTINLASAYFFQLKLSKAFKLSLAITTTLIRLKG